MVLSNKCQHPQVSQVSQVLMAASRRLAPLAGVLVVTVSSNLSPIPILIRAAHPHPPVSESVWLSSDSVSAENRLHNSHGTECGQPSG